MHQYLRPQEWVCEDDGPPGLQRLGNAFAAQSLGYADAAKNVLTFFCGGAVGAISDSYGRSAHRLGPYSIVIFFRHQSHNIARLAFCMDQRHSPSISAAGTADGPAGGQAMGQAGHAREAGRPKFGGDELRARWVDLLAAATAAGAAAPTPGPAACCSPACSWFRVSFRKKREKKETRKVKEVLEKM